MNCKFLELYGKCVDKKNEKRREKKRKITTKRKKRKKNNKKCPTDSGRRKIEKENTR